MKICHSDEQALKEHGRRVKTMAEKLKPCPFCGGEARLQKRERVFIHGKTARAAYVRCLNCNARTERVPYEEYGKLSYSADAHIKAINAWNRRIDVPRAELSDLTDRDLPF